jgi:tetratricopeptide (TPR) repeat protein
MNRNPSRVFSTSSLLLLSPLMLWAQTATSTTSTTTTTTTTPQVTAPQAAHTEIVRRRELADSARQSVIDGQKLLSIEHFDEAADRFQYALNALTPGGESAGLYSRAEAGLAAAKAGQSRALAASGKFAQAAALLQEAIVLQPNDPTYTTDLDNLKQQQVCYEEQARNPEGTVNNPAVTQDFKDKVSEVQKLLFQGQKYFETGQYERAENTFSKILILDPYNKAARDATWSATAIAPPTSAVKSTRTRRCSRSTRNGVRRSPLTSSCRPVPRPK